MKTIHVPVQRIQVVSSRPFDEVVDRLGSMVGHPEMRPLFGKIADARDFEEVKSIVKDAVSPTTDLMEFFRLDPGEVVRKALGGTGPRMLRLLIGNPVTMSRMARHAPDAAAYAPVTILVDERPDGVHLSYDRMASQLEPYGNAEALAVARELDGKVEGILREAARPV